MDVVKMYIDTKDIRYFNEVAARIAHYYVEPGSDISNRTLLMGLESHVSGLTNIEMTLENIVQEIRKRMFHQYSEEDYENMKVGKIVDLLTYYSYQLGAFSGSKYSQDWLKNLFKANATVYTKAIMNFKRR